MKKLRKWNFMKISLIVAVYKDIEALSLIVEALKTQSYKNFELIIAEDNNASQMKNYVASIEGIEYKHTFHDDLGVRKSRSQNNGIIASTGDYLVFIDGDCIPHSKFIEGHAILAEEKKVLSGRRSNLGPKYSAKLRSKELLPLKFEKIFLRKFISIAKDSEEGHVEEGFWLNPKGFFFKKFLKDRNTQLLGCNFSCYKKDVEAINGFDEGYGASPLSDDTDISWRLKASGLELKSCRNVANVFHLFHKRSQKDATTENLMENFVANQKANRFVCEHGLNTHEGKQ